MKPTRPRVVMALASLPMVLTVAACGAGGTNDSAPSSAGGDAAVAPARDAVADRATSSVAGGKTAAVDAIQRSVIATGSLRLTSRRIDDARQDAIGVATGLGGHVADERSRSDTRGRLDRVDLTLRVPAASFEEALDQLSALGTVRKRQQSVEDVTTQVIDTRARVRAQAASVDSIQRLLARATTIAEIMSVEQQLSSRQAELDSLRQQEKYLADQTSLSTIQLTVTRPADHQAAGGSSGFVGGLDRGWHALGDSAVALGTAVGAVLPFAAVLALVGVPIWLVRRRRLRVPGPTPEV